MKNLETPGKTGRVGRYATGHFLYGGEYWKKIVIRLCAVRHYIVLRGYVPGDTVS